MALRVSQSATKKLLAAGKTENAYFFIILNSG